MLLGLTIRDVVLIDRLALAFRPGLCVLTGETGAGKSILLDALGLALGRRADAALLRPGAEQAAVSAEFAVTGDHPAIFNRVDGHIAIANTAALKAAGITAQSPDPHGGKIDRDDKGEPTNILRETAMGAVFNKIPPPSAAQRRRTAELALEDAAR